MSAVPSVPGAEYTAGCRALPGAQGTAKWLLCLAMMALFPSFLPYAVYLNLISVKYLNTFNLHEYFCREYLNLSQL